MMRCMRQAQPVSGRWAWQQVSRQSGEGMWHLHIVQNLDEVLPPALQVLLCCHGPAAFTLEVANLHGAHDEHVSLQRPLRRLQSSTLRTTALEPQARLTQHADIWKDFKMALPGTCSRRPAIC